MHIGDYFGYTEPVVTSVTASVGSLVLLRENRQRKGVTFFNHGSAALYLKLGVGATVNDFTVKLSSGSYFEMILPMYSGSITGTWDTANGSVKITEL